jgi:hypothetical protein
MRTAISLGLALIVGAFALTSPRAANAVNANIAGTACHNYNAADDKYIDYLVSGVRNIDTVAHTVICPLVRSPASATEAVTVYVDGNSAAGYPIACVLYSYDYTGAFIGSASMAGKTGTFDTQVTVAGKWWSTATLYCTLPPSSKGVIFDVDVVQ